MKRWHLTISEKRRIARLALAGQTSSTIARKMRLTRGTVIYFRIKAGLPHGWTRLTEGQKDAVTALSCLGVPHKQIAARLAVPFHHVRGVCIERGLRRADGGTYGSQMKPRGYVQGFVEAVRAREDYIVVLAEKFNLGKVQANAIAHAVLRTSRFKGGRARPLSSVYPQKHYREEYERRQGSRA